MFERGIYQFQKEENVIGVVYTIEGIISLHLNQGRPEHATRLVAWADAIRDKIGNHRPHIEQVDVDKVITTCLAEMGESAFSDACDEGKKMSLDEAVAYALDEEL